MKIREIMPLLEHEDNLTITSQGGQPMAELDRHSDIEPWLDAEIISIGTTMQKTTDRCNETRFFRCIELVVSYDSADAYCWAIQDILYEVEPYSCIFYIEDYEGDCWLTTTNTEEVASFDMFGAILEYKTAIDYERMGGSVTITCA